MLEKSNILSETCCGGPDKLLKKNLILNGAIRSAAPSIYKKNTSPEIKKNRRKMKIFLSQFVYSSI